MKQLLIIRKTTSDQGCFGTAIADNRTWTTAELPWVDLDKNGVRDANVSCIPRGRYTAKKVMSPKRLIWVYELEGVPGGFAVQIHKMNFCGRISEGWQSDVEGCIGLGKGFGKLKNKEGLEQEAITESSKAIDEFMAWAAGVPIQVIISEQFPGIDEISPESKGV